MNGAERWILRQIKKRRQQGWASLLALFYPLTHPRAYGNYLEYIADVRRLKGLVYIQCFMLEASFLKDGG